MTTPVAEAISARGLTRRFGHVRALDGVDLTLGAGQTLALFGENGAGKTTLLKMLGLGLSPDSGTLAIAGIDPRRDARRARARVGWLAHASLLYEDLTPHENLVFWGRLYGVPDPCARAEELLASFDLRAWAEEPTRILSRGMQQRLSLARAVVHEPNVLLLDEPFTGLDPSASATLRAVLGTLRDQGCAIILATHRFDEGLALSDRFMLLARGRVVVTGASSSVSLADLEAHYQRSRRSHEGARP